MELRSRSRSTTPLRTAESHAVAGNNHLHSIAANSRVLRSTRLRSVAEISEETVAMRVTNSSHKSSKLMKQTHSNLTSDYSSEDGEHDLSQTVNSSNHALQHRELQKEAREELIALKMYRDAKEYWNLYPKTDYTYSPHSKDRVELAPGVVNMPNMSRKPIRCADGVDVAHKETNTESASGVQRRLIPRALFGRTSNNNEVRSYKEGRHTSTSVSMRGGISSVFQRLMHSAFFVLCLASQPLAMAHSVVLLGVGQVHRLASSLMMLDTWLLRGASQTRHGEASRQRSKLVSVLALCLVPLLFFLGLHFLLSTTFTVPPTLHERM